MEVTMIEEHNGYKCYRVRTSQAVKLLEATLTEAGQPFKTKINTTKKRGREFMVLLLDA